MPPSSPKPRRQDPTPGRSIAVVEELRPRPVPPFPLIEAKLSPPVVSGRPISRADIVERLQAEHAAVVSVVAPAGYGKSTLLEEWSRLDRRPFAWVTVDERDDPFSLCAYVAFAMHRTEPVDAPVTEALAGLAPPRVVAPLLAGALARRRIPFVLVVEDVHLLVGTGAVNTLTLLLNHVPRGSTIVLSGRVKSKVPLARLRVQGRLSEVGTDELHLSTRQTHLLLGRARVAIPEQLAARLARRAEGWPAGLQLAALSLRRRPLTAELVDDFSGTDRYVSDYFRQELLGRLPESTIEFLTRISVLDRFSGPQCDALLGRLGAARALDMLEDSCVFMVALDRHRRVYRFHRLFRDLLRAELERREPGLAPTLHARAADWYEAHGAPELAVDHRIDAGQLDRAKELVERLALDTVDRGGLSQLEHWLARLETAGLLGRDAGLAALRAFVEAMRGRSINAERWVETAAALAGGSARSGIAPVLPWLALIRSAMCREGATEMLREARSALADLPRTEPLHPAALHLVGDACLLAGDEQAAEQAYADAAAAAAETGGTVVASVALASLSLIACARHDVERARTLEAEARKVVASGGIGDYGTTMLVDAATARAAAAAGDVRSARIALDHAYEIREELNGTLPWAAARTRIELVQAYLAAADVTGARRLLPEIESLIRHCPALEPLGEQLEELRAHVSAGVERSAGWVSALTAAELRLLPLLATHLTFREIGDRFFVSRNTVKSQAISIYRKLGVSSRSDAIERAAELGLLDSSAVPQPQHVTPAG
jgi:LuxR family transcriptional regulator, maltose regulon positive regulatory protein